MTPVAIALATSFILTYYLQSAFCVESSTSSTTAGCGVTNGCWLSSSDCDQSSCSYMISWTPNTAANYATLQLSAVVPSGSSPYVAMAFSEDTAMGNDYAIACWWNGTTVNIQDGYTVSPPGHFFSSPSNVGVGVIGGSYYPDSQIISCNFKRTLTQAGNSNAKLLTAGNSYYLFIVVGSQVSSSGVVEHTNVYISSTAVDITMISTMSDNSGEEEDDDDDTAFVQAHAVLMIFAWMVAFPIGAIVGRHYRVTLGRKSKLGNNKIWFHVHIGMQISGTILCAASFIVIFVGAKEYSFFTDSPDYTHPILGIVVMGLCIINFCIGLASPGRAQRNTCKGQSFRWVHLICGHSSILLAFANIMVALLMVSEALPSWLLAFPIAFMVLHLLMMLTLQVHEERNKPRRSCQSPNQNEASHSNETDFSDIAENNNNEQATPTQVETEAEKPTRKRVSMFNNALRKNLLYVYIALVSAIAIAFSATLAVNL